MTQTVSPEPKKKGNTVLRAMIDLLIIILLITGAGFGGYFWGVHQQLAPVLKVGAGTPGALPPPLNAIFGGAADKKSEMAASATSKPAEATAATSPNTANAPAKETSTAGESRPAAHGKTKYWITSSGADYIGYSITVKVNGTPVDSFFGPGKLVDVTGLVKAGDNTLECESKQMGEQYNKHTGDGKFKLTLQLVSGPHISDSFKKSDVLQTYERTAADTEDSTDSLHFTGS